MVGFTGGQVVRIGWGVRCGNRVIRPIRLAPVGFAVAREPHRRGSKSRERAYGCLWAPKAPMIAPTWWYLASKVPAIPVGVASSLSLLVR